MFYTTKAMEINKENVLQALSFVIEPDLKKDIVALNLVSEIEVKGPHLSFKVQISNPALHNRKRMEEACLHHLYRFFGEGVQATISVEALAKDSERSPELRKLLPGVKNIIAIASGKGGVGKSTVTSNLAVALAEQGYKVGLVDADIYGPSIPLMFDVYSEKPTVIEIDGKQWIEPVVNHNVKVLSIGFFADTDQAIVWRGPMAAKALVQLFRDVNWGELDYMLIDLPPGTGDIHLSLVQTVPLTGVVVVSTPQEVALIDARKAVGMFRLNEINVPILGFVENMAYFTPAELPNNKYYIFGKDGLKNLAETMQIPLLGEIPLVQSIREAGDAGRPAVLQQTTPQAIAFSNLAKNVVKVCTQKQKELI
ncbi:MAG: Iron-sulfur cluster carrier protein [Flavobacteriales bacterium]|nr:Iron-sulfur cluster carrier protein [Flavobacteriales bacterium]